MEDKEILKQLVTSVEEIRSALLGNLKGEKGIVALVKEHDTFICGVKKSASGLAWKLVAVFGASVFAGASGSKIIGVLLKYLKEAAQ